MKIGVFKSCIAVGVLSFSVFLPAIAGQIPVVNSSFEQPSAGGLTLTAGCVGPGCFYSEGVGVIPGWSNSKFSGEFVPGTQVGNFQSFGVIPDGIAIAFANTASITQTVGSLVNPGTIYTLNVDLGWANTNQIFTGTADLFINGIRYVAVGQTPTQGGWSTFTASYTGLAIDSNKAITIELKSTGTFSQQATFDNVRLTASVPEPSSLLLAFAGITFVSAVVRRKRLSLQGGRGRGRKGT